MLFYILGGSPSKMCCYIHRSAIPLKPLTGDIDKMYYLFTVSQVIGKIYNMAWPQSELEVVFSIM